MLLNELLSWLMNWLTSTEMALHSVYFFDTRAVPDSPAYTFLANYCLYQMGHCTMQFSSNVMAPMIATPMNKVIF